MDQLNKKIREERPGSTKKAFFIKIMNQKFETIRYQKE